MRTRTSTSPYFRISLLLLLILVLGTIGANATPWDHKSWPPPTSTADVTASVPITAVATATPTPAITLNFIRSGTYQIFRKDPAATTWGTALATTAAASTTYTDSTVSVGQLYEYKCILTDAPTLSPALIYLPPSGNFGLGNGTAGPPTGYIVSGINVDETQPRGRIIVVVASDVPTNLPTEYNQYISDLQADGWFVHVISVAPLPISPVGYDVAGPNAAATINVTNGGSGYVSGTTGTQDATGLMHFTNGNGNAALGTITVSSGVITAVTVSVGGAGGGFTVGDTLTISNVKSSTGTGATFTIGSVSNLYPNPSVIRAQIQAIYNQYPGEVKNLVMVGRVPACRSGLYEYDDPDGHGVNLGATGADGYYANMTGTWTDTGSNLPDYGSSTGIITTTGELNTKGDGKFDQLYMKDTGGEADMGFGRIDLSNGISGQYEALKAYFRKLHRFKTASPDFLPGRRIILRTGDFENVDGTCWGMAYGVNPHVDSRGASYSSGPPSATNPASDIDCIATSDLPVENYSDTDAAYSAQHGPYLFYFKGSGGPGIGIGGQAVFWTGMQSHWGWWYSSTTSSGENSEELRLGENSFGLSWTWDIFGTRYFYHRMNMGFDAGDMMRVSINNADAMTGTYSFVTDPATTDGGAIFVSTGGLFMNHIGDPTLRFFMLAPPTNLAVVPVSGQPSLSWTPSTDSAVIGYHVYRAPLTAGLVTAPYTRVTSSPVSGSTFTDPGAGPGTGQWSYMVRAIKLETTGSGTFYNASLGAVQTIDQTNGPATLAIASPATLPSANWNTAYPTVLTATGGTPNYSWTVLNGSLPPGLTLNTNGSFSGLATMAGTYTFTAKVTDAASQSQQQTFSLTALSNNTVTLIPEVSSYVYSTAPTRVQGPTETMTVAGASTTNSFLRFNLAGQNFHNSFVSAILRVYVAPGTTANSIALLSAALTSDNYIAWLVDNGPAVKITSAVNYNGYYRITCPGHGLDPRFGLTTTIGGTTPTSPTTINAAYPVTYIDANTFDIPTLPYNSQWIWTNATSTPSNGITYNFQPQDNSAVAPVSATAFPVPYSTVDLDVTSLMKTCLANDPSGKVGFRLFTNSGQTVNLCSAFSYGGAIPQLIIQTTDAPKITITSPAVNPAAVYVGSGLQLSATITAIPANAANLTQQWSMVSGPGTVTFSTPTATSTTATFSAAGDYVLQLLANDSVLQSTQTITVRVVSDPINGPTDSLTLHLPFNESSGTTTSDTSGSGNNGTLSGGAGFSTAGFVGNALTTNGSSQVVTIPDTASTSNPVDGQTAITISMWVNPTVLLTDASTVTLISKSGAFAISIRQQTNGGQVFNSIAGITSQQSGKRLATNTWTNIVAVFNGATSTNTLQLYINGVPDIFTNSTVTSVLRKTGVNTYIGGTSATDAHGFNGLIDEVRIYKRALTLAEIEDVAAGAPPDTGPVITTTASLSGAVGTPLTLSATVTSSKPPSSLSYLWSEINGPATLTIGSPTSISTSTTPTAPGAYNLLFSANDGAVTTFANVAAGITGQTYAGWTTLNGLSGPSASQTAVIAHDGLNNLYKYALGLTPATNYNPGSAALPSVFVQNSGGTNYLALTFTGVATDVTYTVQATSNLNGTWSPVQTFSSGTAPGTVTVQDSQPMSSSSKRYMRLLMTLTPTP